MRPSSRWSRSSPVPRRHKKSSPPGWLAGFTSPVFATTSPGSHHRPSTSCNRAARSATLNTNNGQIGAIAIPESAHQSRALISSSGGEQGLLGLAFHPNYQANGLFYVNYTTTNGTDPGGAIRVQEYPSRERDRDPGSRRTIIQFNHPRQTTTMADGSGSIPLNGITGPNSGHLYITVGDGGGPTTRQTTHRTRMSCSENSSGST